MALCRMGLKQKQKQEVEKFREVWTKSNVESNTTGIDTARLWLRRLQGM